MVAKKNWDLILERRKQEVREQREATLRALQGSFGSEAKIRPYGKDIMDTQSEAYTIIAENATFENLQRIKRLNLEIRSMSAYKQLNGEARIIIGVQREGVEIEEVKA